jgi:hypothetical protein
MYITFFPEIVPFRRQSGKNIAEWVRPQMTIWYTRFACHITKATHTHTLRICNFYCFSTATMAARKYLNVTVYVHCLSYHSLRCPVYC